MNYCEHGELPYMPCPPCQARSGDRFDLPVTGVCMSCETVVPFEEVTCARCRKEEGAGTWSS